MPSYPPGPLPVATSSNGALPSQGLTLRLFRPVQLAREPAWTSDDRMGLVSA